MTDKLTLFVECDTCKALPGQPTLCNGCVRNRATIARLELEREAVKVIINVGYWMEQRSDTELDALIAWNKQPPKEPT